MLRLRRRPVALGLITLTLLAAGAAVAPVPAPAAQRTLGIVTFSSSDVVTQAFVKATAAYAQGKGWAVDTVDAQGQLTQANTAITDLAQKHVTAILVTVFPSASLAQGLAAARAARIPVVSAGGGLAPGVAMSTDDGDAPPMISYMLHQLHNSGKILELTYHPGLPCYERATQFEAAVKKLPNIHVTQHEIMIPGEAETSKRFTLAWLAANPAGAGNFAIYNCYDDNALGAIAALKQNHRSGVKVYSFNATPPALQEIKSGWMTATLWLNLPKAGRDLVDSLTPILAQGSAWKPRMILAAYVIVDRKNLAAFEKAHPEALKS